MIVGTIKENTSLEKRVSLTPDSAKNIIGLGLKVCVEKGYALHLGIGDKEYSDIGVEIKSSPIEINSNFYSRLSGDKSVGSTTERAMDGIDAEIGFQIPYMPNSKLFFQGYEWDGSDYDIDSGNKISLRLRPSSSLQIEIGAEDNNRQSDYKATASITFTKTFGEIERNSGIYISEQLFEFQDMSNEIYDSVRRQNRIVKTVTGTVTVARGT